MKGTTLWLGFLLTAVGGGAQDGGLGVVFKPLSVSVRFEVALQAPSKAPVRGRVKLTRQGARDAEGTDSEVSVAIEAGRETRIALPAGSAWEAQVVAPGFWVRRFSFPVAGVGDQVQRLDVWPLGSVVGRLVSAEKPPALPKKLVVTTLPLRSTAKNRAVPKGEIECPVDLEGRFRCEMPAATYDLSVFVETFIPLYSWDVSVAGGGETDLKTLTLRRGASLAGWVAAGAEGVVDPEKCRVILSPTVASGGADIGAIEKLSLMGREAKVNGRGFFQFVGLAPGSYIVGVEQEGALGEPRGPIQVAAGGETYLPEPFLLEAPLDLELVVEPAKDWLGRSWAVKVERSLGPGDPRTETVFEGNTSADGVARARRQKRGMFTVRVSDSTGQKMLTEYNLVFNSPADARRVFEIPWIEVEGSVRLGDEPLQASLWFGGRSGPTSIRIDTDKEGRFAGALSREGHWRIDLAAESPPIALQLRRTLEAKKGMARLEIEVPDTRIFGRVVGPSGQPEPHAMVSALESDGSSQILSADNTGNFELRGVAPGELGLVAETLQGDLAGDQVILAVGKDSEIGPVELRLQKKARFAGRVLTAHGAAAGAAVTVLGIRPARFGSDRARAAADGSFEARLPAGTESAEAVVAALGSALTAFELKPGPSVDLTVVELGGRVEVTLGAPFARRVSEEGAFLMLFQNGLELPPYVLSAWARSHGESSSLGGRRHFPALAPGSYSACLVPVSSFLDLSQTGWSPKLAIECRSGSLAPGGTLRLEFGKSDEKPAGTAADGGS